MAVAPDFGLWPLRSHRNGGFWFAICITWVVKQTTNKPPLAYPPPFHASYILLKNKTQKLILRVELNHCFPNLSLRFARYNGSSSLFSIIIQNQHKNKVLGPLPLSPLIFQFCCPSKVNLTYIHFPRLQNNGTYVLEGYVYFP